MGLFTFTLPDIGEGIHEGEIVKWHIKPGDQVEEDQTIVEVQNDKAVVEIPSPVNGVVKEISVTEGTVAIVGDLLVTFEVAGEGNQSTVSPAEKVEEMGGISTDEKHGVTAPAKEAPAPKSASETRQEPMDKTLVLATPSIRRLAREQGVDLTRIEGTGPNGRITREDVLNYNQTQVEQTVAPTVTEAATNQPVQPLTPPAVVTDYGQGSVEIVPLKGIRKVIAEAMVRSKYTAPHVTLIDEVDVTKLVDFRKRVKPMMEQKQIKVTYLPFIVKAVVGALRQFPVLNASIDDAKGEILYKKFYNIGIATDTDQGLMVPVIADADRKSIWRIASEINELAVKARDGKLSPGEMKNGTFTITNIGSAGGQYFTPVINYPEVAILGTGRITEKPVVKNGLVQAAPVMGLSLSFDHRLIDGASAQHFINYLKEVLSEPDFLLMEV
ncbi:dihydrolipoamide acetyltransferase family protein [Ammoniphilus resinae]|uniref:Dihydrolipoamide acetyltransferase component of pyruvate dehydrogenase complex n=1 Tax=Ammoniphilus resinae TaxID=861532 RepID=A0ABS4GKF8_9BACL|nr:dihydrolipoamide acetyltransferase family protein [Ammoniphilus resinae]MBP1930736.1 pyruvate dehydrogenase E2 component (dihydrolipoamide acetyltransferase) [Ammoniphilus resinae]